jgi:hypothetical protein
MTEYRVLVLMSDTIVNSLSADPVVVAQTLFARFMIPLNVLESQQIIAKTKTERARELVGEVVKIVKEHPQKFKVFMEVLKEELWLEDLVKQIQETHRHEVRHSYIGGDIGGVMVG